MKESPRLVDPRPKLNLQVSINLSLLVQIQNVTIHIGIEAIYMTCVFTSVSVQSSYFIDVCR